MTVYRSDICQYSMHVVKHQLLLVLYELSFSQISLLVVSDTSRESNVSQAASIALSWM